MACSSVSIVNFEHVIAGWVILRELINFSSSWKHQKTVVFIINWLSASVVLIQKPVNWFAVQINWPVST